MELKAKEERKDKLYTLYIHIPAQRSIYKPKQYIFFTKCTCVAVKVPSGLQKWVSPMLYITHINFWDIFIFNWFSNRAICVLKSFRATVNFWDIFFIDSRIVQF